MLAFVRPAMSGTNQPKWLGQSKCYGRHFKSAEYVLIQSACAVLGLGGPNPEHTTEESNLAWLRLGRLFIGSLPSGFVFVYLG